MHKKLMNSPGEKSKLSVAAGFSVAELLIVVALIGIVTSFALISFLNANKGFKLAGATRTLSTHLEKARVDSVRRHGGASINIDSATSYTVGGRRPVRVDRRPALPRARSRCQRERVFGTLCRLRPTSSTLPLHR